MKNNRIPRHQTSSQHLPVSCRPTHRTSNDEKRRCDTPKYRRPPSEKKLRVIGWPTTSRGQTKIIPAQVCSYSRKRNGYSSETPMPRETSVPHIENKTTPKRTPPSGRVAIDATFIFKIYVYMAQMSSAAGFSRASKLVYSTPGSYARHESMGNRLMNAGAVYMRDRTPSW